MPHLDKVVWEELNTEGVNIRYSGFVIEGHGIMIRKQGNNLLVYRGKQFNCSIINVALGTVEVTSSFTAAAIKLADALENFQQYQSELENL